MSKYIFGAFGTNNVGDEAIFEGASQVYDDVVEIFVNKSNRANSVWYADLLEGRTKFPDECDELIMGGGGLLHSKNAVVDYLRMAKLAISQGKQFSIQRIGCENQSPEYDSLASSISVRSQKSKEIVNALGFNCEIEQDFALELEIPSSKVLNPYKTVGLVTNCLNGANFDKFIPILKAMVDKVQVVHIPHSRAFVNANNNDVVAAQKLWSSIEIYHNNRDKKFITLPYSNNPYKVLDTYSGMSGIIGMRYHSFLFSEITKKPLLGYTVGTKFSEYFKERGLDNYIDYGADVNTIIEKTMKFIESL